MMKRLIFIMATVFIVISLVLVNCGLEKMTRVKARSIIDKEIHGLVKKLQDNWPDMSPYDLQILEKDSQALKKSFEVADVKQDGKSYIAKVYLEPSFEVKLQKGESGWQVAAMRKSGEKWLLRSQIIDAVQSEYSQMMSIEKRMKATYWDVKNLGTALMIYIIDNEEAPQVKTMAELEKILTPFYIKRMPKKDAWGNDFYYYHGSDEKKKEFAIASAGSDGKFEGFDQKGTYTDYKGKDIIYVNGEFTYGPVK